VKQLLSASQTPMTQGNLKNSRDELVRAMSNSMDA
jgi:hypothetical protein